MSLTPRHKEIRWTLKQVRNRQHHNVAHFKNTSILCQRQHDDSNVYFHAVCEVPFFFSSVSLNKEVSKSNFLPEEDICTVK